MTSATHRGRPAKALTLGQRRVVLWAAEECKRQGSGELSVSWMLNAWHAMRTWPSRESGLFVGTTRHVLELGLLVEPEVNKNGYRTVGVRVGWSVKGPWQKVPAQIDELLAVIHKIAPDAFYRRFEEIHPFRDGNGRVGALWHAWMTGTLGNPIHPPDWDDPAAYWADDDAVGRREALMRQLTYDRTN